jgi:hypothetical protein
MTRKSKRKSARKALVAAYIQSNPAEGYDGMAARANESYRKTKDIRETMSETGLSFSEVYEAVGFKDADDFEE